MSELRTVDDCPNCDARFEDSHLVINLREGYIKCTECGLTGPTSGGDMEMVVANWNNLPRNDALAAENARLKQLLARAAVVLLDVDARIVSGILRDKIKLMVDEIVAATNPAA